jgi:hypothetical protein
MKRLLTLVGLAGAVLLVACAPKVSLSPGFGGPSLIPKGTAIAIQPTESPDVVTGKIAHIDAHRVIILTDDAGSPSTLTGSNIEMIRTYVRDEVLALYRRPGSRLGIGFLIGAAVGTAAGVWLGGGLCDDFSNCKPSYWRSNDRKNLSKLCGSVSSS